MSGSRIVHYILVFALLLAVGGGLAGNQAVLATQDGSEGLVSLPVNQEEPPPEEKLELVPLYPILRGSASTSLEFEVQLKYEGSKSKTFELAVTGVPPGWSASIKPSYGEGEIAAMTVEPFKDYVDRVKVGFSPIWGNLPEPGNYVITLEVWSGDIRETVELTREVIAVPNYNFYLYTATGRLNTEVKAGEDNHLSLLLENSGTAAIANISLWSTKPEGWSVTFNPDKVDSLEAGLIQEVDAVITPPRKTVAGDYSVTIRAQGKEDSESMELRVTVLTPTIWGWVGIIIVLVVIAGVAILFRQLGRR